MATLLKFPSDRIVRAPRQRVARPRTRPTGTSAQVLSLPAPPISPVEVQKDRVAGLLVDRAFAKGKVVSHAQARRALDPIRPRALTADEAELARLVHVSLMAKGRPDTLEQVRQRVLKASLEMEQRFRDRAREAWEVRGRKP
ncbi:hypothetical protein [Pseudoxanthomonas winnipegensis]|uniref:Uncharacterized protein n=1 Tax=Pseudoxanthomonas winnipegensis TaxID=2480810 RepID=A0A4Q8LAS2_9GAMM|nr:hypothetical protein [Pseudoxanthomonas winnipegensis]TAA25429.1 hypothetical protein EA660_08190 [Pseudoxanthomonas winnipegensis]